MKATVLGVAVALAGSLGWRTDGTGKYPQAEPPINWSADTNILWKTPMPGWSNATAVVCGQRIFVCSEPAELLCLNAADGKILWQRSNSYEQLAGPDKLAEVKDKMRQAGEIAKQISDHQARSGQIEKKLKDSPDDEALKKQADELAAQIAELKKRLAPLEQYAIPATHDDNGHSSATPVADGKHVWVVTGLGTVACYDVEGNRKWIRFLEKPTHNYGHSASPLLVDGKLIVHIRDAVALDAASGEEIWRVKSNTNDLWGTAACAEVDGTKLLIAVNGDVIAVSDGRVLAKGISKLKYASPVVEDGVAYFAQFGGRAMKLPEKVEADFKCLQLWQAKDIPNDRYYASAVVHQGLVYAITQKGVLVVLDAADGKLVYKQSLKLGKGTVYPSITLAGENLYVSSDSGVTIVMAPGRQYRELASNQLGKFRSCPVFVGKRLYVRGYEYLYCIGQ